MCEVNPTPPLNITMVKIKNGSRLRGHVRYPNTKETLNYTRKERKPHGNKTPPQITMHKIKNEKEQNIVVKQLCPSLQEDLTTVQVCAC